MIRRILHAIVARPAVYNLLQRIAGIRESRRRIGRFLRETSGTVLDVGAGTGNFADLIPASARYIWFDNDRQKLGGFRRAFPTALAVMGDASRMAIRDQGVDYAMSVDVSHHLTDTEFDSFLKTLAGVCRRGFIFLDAVDRPDSMVSRVLWKYDRGRHPRQPDRLRAFLSRYFEIRSEESYRIYHTYLLCLAIPKTSSAAPETAAPKP